MRRTAGVSLILALALSCGGKKETPAGKAEAAPTTAPAAVPVRVETATHATVAEVISAPGKTAALVQQKVRAPFAGALVEFRVADGDIVHKGDALGTIVSRESGAALNGAREMLREAKTPAETLDAERAVALAERALVTATLRAPASGAVLSHAAASGDRVSEDQELLTIADASSIVFLSDVAQSDLARVKAGQPTAVDLAGRKRSVPGVVHAVLPGANAADFTVPVRVDLKAIELPPPIGLYGTARITVGGHRDALVVPEASVLRNDVTGISRVAVVRNGRAQWVVVMPGLRQDGAVEIVSPALTQGETVIVSGQVGLPDGAAVSVQK